MAHRLPLEGVRVVEFATSEQGGLRRPPRTPLAG